MLRQLKGQQHLPGLAANGGVGVKVPPAVRQLSDSGCTSDQEEPTTTSSPPPSLNLQHHQQQPSNQQHREQRQGEVLSALLDVSLLSDRNKAFDVFRQSYSHNAAIEENKQLLKSKYDEAKGLGAAVNGAKGRIQQLRAALEQRRMQRSAACEFLWFVLGGGGVGGLKS